MWKTILTGTAVVMLMGSAASYAQQNNEGQLDRVQRWRPSAEDVTAFGDARIAALHAGLKLNADQEKNWPAVESALRDLVKQRVARFAARASANQPRDPIERLNARADVMQQRAIGLKKLADAAGPLYKSLDDSQKRRFVLLTAFARHQSGRMGSRMGHHRFGGWMDQDRGRLQDRLNDGHMGPQQPQ
jgi:zinc resistance-associated protein